jgi:hypothetical protein
MSGLAPYIFGAAVVAFALDYFAQSFGTGLSASGRMGIQSETTRPLNDVDRLLKGDRLPGGQSTNGQATSGAGAIGHIEPRPAKAAPDDAPRSPDFQPKIPDGCDPAFSPLAPAEQINPVARCLT